MNDEQLNNIERVLGYEADLLARCQGTVNRTRRLRETAVQVRSHMSRFTPPRRERADM